ncbi:MAG: ABC transporter ATP-binding protein [Gemmatimonadota bacterium]|nr:ABC transporter ATP-binding protein [Gemmatimonadota bacterium]
MTDPRVRMSGVVRRFGAVVALDGADLELLPGEVHGVLGENGAGKTTLLNILSGLLTPDEGTVEVDGRRVELRTPRDAWRHGIGMVHQHFKLVPGLTVLENLSLGFRGVAGGFALPYAEVRERVRQLGERTGLRVDVERGVRELSVGQRQRVEILKALLRDPGILVLDEPTAVLAPEETEALFELLRGLASEGRAVVLVAHKLDEVLAASNRLTVLRHGRTVYTGGVSEANPDALVRAMVGEHPAAPVGMREDASEGAAGEVVAELAGATVRDASGAVAVGPMSLDVRRGEIVGVAGVEGNGQRELARLLAGRMRPDAGVARIPRGTGFIPEDRTTEGLVGSFDLTENVALSLHDRDIGPRWLMPWAEARKRAEDVRTRYRVHAPATETTVAALSGGNQQRLLVGRELGVAADLLVAENPTRGLDVAATVFVRRELVRHARLGARAPGIVLISSDLDEVLELSDRVLVMVRGALRPVPEGQRSRSGVGALMLSAGP